MPWALILAVLLCTQAPDWEDQDRQADAARAAERAHCERAWSAQRDALFAFEQERWVWEAGGVRTLAAVLPADEALAVRALRASDYAGRATAGAYIDTGPDRLRTYTWGLFHALSAKDPDLKHRCVAALAAAFACPHCEGSARCPYPRHGYPCPICGWAASEYDESSEAWWSRCKGCDSTGSFLGARGLRADHFERIRVPAR